MRPIVDRVAGAPITWGACEVPGWGHQLPRERVLAEMSAIGLRATELGPEGFLPNDPAGLRDLLAGHGLRLVGGFHPVVLHLRDGLDERLRSTRAYADRLAAAGADVLVLAAAAPEAGYEGSPELDRDAWVVLASAIRRIVEAAGERGLAVAVHPHHGTAIERPEHIARFLEVSDAALCLDTGHVLVGGGDPLEIAKSSGDRIAHAHLKDVDAELAEHVRSGALTYLEGVRRGMYRPLGRGDVDVDGIVRSLHAAGYDGWFVLEQDTVLDAAPAPGAGPAAAAKASLEFLGRVAAEMEVFPAEGPGGAWAAQGARSSSGEEVG